jgi:hypothetical protein
MGDPLLDFANAVGADSPARARGRLVVGAGQTSVPPPAQPGPGAHFGAQPLALFGVVTTDWGLPGRHHA